ncbi:MAG: PHP domain-containing protein [Clostridia bacterium]|nr:PHP domain-containing protein [Clostridia bacterium]
MTYPKKIDLHMHTVISDGTDTPSEIIEKVKEKGIELFSVTDHDAVKSSALVKQLLKKGDPAFVPGVEFSCKDSEGRYHILGYNYDIDAKPITQLVNTGHNYRIEKLRKRLDFLESEFSFTFGKQDIDALFSLDNPGKPHIGNIMVKYGYAKTKEDAINNYINRFHSKNEYVKPDDAIKSILLSNGIPVLAHPVYGRGDELILGEDLVYRIKKLISFGLMGVEAFYSGFTSKLQNEVLSLAEEYNLLVTAGSDYHGKNKMVTLGDTNLNSEENYPQSLKRFIDMVYNKK